MKISYKKLWKLLIDKDMLKKDLAAKAEISSTSIAKLSKNENVNTAAFVVHGGTIMSILSELGDEGKSYYDYITDNGEGFVCEWEDGKCRNIMRL